MRKIVLAALMMAILLALTGCSGSYSSYDGGSDHDRQYDRHFDDGEISDFVNSYGGGW